MQAARGASLNDAGTPVPPSASPAQRSRRASVAVLGAVALAVYALDQVSKVVAVRELTGRDPVELVPGVLSLRLVYNPGAAFGIAGGATALFSVVAAVVVVVVVRLASRLRSRTWALALGLLLGGATGNLTDRLVRDPAPLRGRVVDFLELPNWPVFNVADMAIVSAASLMVLLSLRGRQIDGTRADG